MEFQVGFYVLPANAPSEHSIDKELACSNVDHSHEGRPDLSLKLPVSQTANAQSDCFSDHLQEQD